DRPGTAISNRGKQLLAAVDAIGEDMPKPGKALPQRAQQRHRAMRILDVGWMHLHRQQEALGVGDDVALAALDALAGIDPARAAAFRGWHALAVDDRRRGGGAAPGRTPGPDNQRGADPLQGAIVAPAIEISLHGRA